MPGRRASRPQPGKRTEEERREAAKVWKRERLETDEQMILGLRAVQDALGQLLTT